MEDVSASDQPMFPGTSNEPDTSQPSPTQNVSAVELE